MMHTSQYESNDKSKKILKPWLLFFHQCATPITTSTTTTDTETTTDTTSTAATAVMCYVFS